MDSTWSKFPLVLLQPNEGHMARYEQYIEETQQEFEQLYMGQWSPTDDEIAAAMERIIEEALARAEMRARVDEFNSTLAIALKIPARYLRGE